MANKELGDHVFFEGIEYEGHECEGYGLIDNEDGIPVFYIICGSYTNYYGNPNYDRHYSIN